MSLHTNTGPVSAAERMARQAAFRVKVSKFIGMLAGLIGVLVFATFLMQSGFFTNFVTQPIVVPEKVDNPTLISGTQSNISGIDKDSQPYEIKAEKGIQDKSTGSLVHLETVTGVFHRPNNKQINLLSKTAVYDSKTKAMALDGDVVFEEPGRYTAKMQKADVNLDDKSLVSRSPVHVDMSTGTVEADSLEILDNGKRSLFKGRVKARFETIMGSGDH
jgi:lipopolysaccharide export system protein LptC